MNPKDLTVRPASYQECPPLGLSTHTYKGGAPTIPAGIQAVDPKNGECPNCRGRWHYRLTTDGDGRTSEVEDYFEVAEPCEAHQSLPQNPIEQRRQYVK